MPLYEFRCPLGHDFEKFYRSIGAAQSEEKCPECGEIAARLMSAAGLVFKGSGFYITDYGKDGKKDLREATKAAKPDAPAAESKPAEPAAKPAETGTASPAPKTEAKPAAAPAPKASTKKAE
jgi:putative FmdB family regulatory protein